MSPTATTTLESLADKVRQLPTLPTVYIKVAELMNDPNASAADISKVIVHDQAIAAKLLRVVNSSFFGLSQRVSTVSRAITIIGFRGLRDIILTLSALRVLRPWSDGKTFDDRTFWAHGVGCAACARATAIMLRSSDPEESFTAGLLHDIGKLTEYWFLRDEFLPLAWEAHEKKIPLYVLEKEKLGFTHADVGRLLAERWQLPENLIDSIAFHHTPSESRFPREAAIVHLADIMARAMILSNDQDSRVPPLDMAAWNNIGLTTDKIEPLMRATEEEFAKGKEFLSILGNS